MGNLETITITLDGLEVSGSAGMTILDLAKESNVEIPTLCSDPNLAPIGACRICIVEDERNGTLLASCVTPISPGMLINTKSPAVIEHRKNIVKLMLASHPDTCMVCDKGNRCQLRQVAGNLGIGLTDLYKIPQFDSIIDLNPFLERDLSKCILCGKCIRADQELVVEGALDYFERGFIAKPATFGHTALELSECTFCGTCVAVCPTGALSEKVKIYRGTSGTSAETICPYCASGCTVSIEIKDGQVIRTRPGKGDSVNKGTLCILGSYGLDFINSRERLTSPLIRMDGKLEPTNWEIALDIAARGLKEIIDSYSSRSIGVIGSTRCTNEENYLLQKFAWCSLGTNNIDNSSRLYDAAKINALNKVAGVFGVSHLMSGMFGSDIVLLFNTDPETTSPILSYAFKREVKFRGAKLVLIDSDENSLEYLSHLWLRPKPGTETALVNSLARVIIDENLFDREYIKSRTENFNEYQVALHGYSPQKVEDLCGVSAEAIEKAGRLLAGAKKPAFLLGTHTYQQPNQAAGIQALINLFLLIGNLEDDSSTIIPVLQESNSLGACDMGTLTGYLPGYVELSDINSRKLFEDRWGINISGSPGLNALDMLHATGDKIRGLYIMGENPVAWLPAPVGSEAISRAKFVVVQDIFLSDTARLAHVVLPSCSFAEKEGTFTNLEGRVQKLRSVTEMLPGCLSDWEIILNLSAKMGVPLAVASLTEIRNEIEQLVPFYTKLVDFCSSSKTIMDTVSARRKYKGNKSDNKYRFIPVLKSPVIERFREYGKEISRAKLSDFGTGTRVNHTVRLKQNKVFSTLERVADE